MWRSSGNRSFQKIKFLLSDFCSVSHKSFVGSQDSSFFGRISSFGDSPCNVNRCWLDEAFYQPGGVHWFCSRFSICGERNYRNFRGFSSAVEAIVSTEDESDGVEELNNQMAPEMKVVKQPKLVGGITRRKYLLLWRRQMKMETEAWIEAAKEYQELIDDMCKQKLAPDLPFMKSLFLGWFEPFRDAIAAEQESCDQGSHKKTYGPYLVRLPANMIAVITMHKLMGLLMTTREGMNSGCRVLHAALQIGEAIEHEVRIQNFLDKTKRTSASSKDINNESYSPTEQQEKLRKKFTCLIKKKKLHQVQSIVKEHDHGKSWGQEVQVKVGSRLIQLLMETAYIQSPVDHSEDGPPDIRPAFVHNLEIVDTRQGTRMYGVIECDPLVRKGLERTPRHLVLPYMPMLVPPTNWTGYDKGAYLCLPSYIMRTHGAKEQREAIKRVSKKHIEPIFEALNTLGNTKWRVNKRILDIVDKIWASGGRVAGLVDREDVDLPEEPDTEDEVVTRKWRWKVREAKKVNSERQSHRCDIELKLAVSRKLKDEDGFYYPHNLDFRGRAYPLHPHLNHLGSDLCRGILEFAEGRPLGKSGLRWLKIHLANLYAGGVDKFSYEGRVAFTDKHVDDIFDSADRPLDGKQWWLKAEDPFQCLATCINLSEALRSSSPESTLSYIPIHQDGSCNGLQHYAALGRDKEGAAAVNLVAGEKPADVYSGVADRVLDIMRRDAAKDPASNPNVLLARLLVNQVDRKLVKQTVMTSVYGVTYIGARDQIKSRLKERGLIQDADELFAAAWYAAKTTLTALEELFQAARSIMSWLGDCAKVITMENQPVRWITPLGLPVVQPYRKKKIIKIITSLQALTLHRETDKVFGRQQRAAFPANFVHSLDGTHMMMTAIACKEAGLNFAGVHDSYWTHACDVDKMNLILREKFVELYETPILENLQDSFQKTFPKLDFPPLPERGDFDLNEVLRSPYFFN